MSREETDELKRARDARGEPGRPKPRRSSRAPEAAILLPLLGFFLLMPPMIGLFAVHLDIVGLPLIVIYVFGVWLALVVCAALLARRLTHSPSDSPGERVD